MHRKSITRGENISPVPPEEAKLVLALNSHMDTPCSPPGLLRPFKATDFSVNLIASMNTLPREKEKHIHPCNHIFYFQFLAIFRLQKLNHEFQFRNPNLGYRHGRDICPKPCPGKMEGGGAGRDTHCLIGNHTGGSPNK